MNVLVKLAKEALDIQNTCNLNIVHRFSGVIKELRAAFPDADTTTINRHPICVLWADKIKSLTGDEYSDAYTWASDLVDMNSKLSVANSSVDAPEVSKLSSPPEDGGGR